MQQQGYIVARNTQISILTISILIVICKPFSFSVLFLFFFETQVYCVNNLVQIKKGGEGREAEQRDREGPGTGVRGVHGAGGTRQYRGSQKDTM